MPVLLLIVFIDLAGFGMIVPLLPFYAEHHGASPFQVTALMALYSLMQFATAPLLGSLSDRFGRKPVLIGSLAGAVGGYVLMAFAPSYAWLAVSRAFAGAAAGNIAAAQACVADMTTPEQRARGMGLFGAAFGAGFIVGPALGGLLAGPADAVDFMTPPLAAAAAAAAALTLAGFALREPRRAETARPPTAIARSGGAWLGAPAAAWQQAGLRPLVALFFVVILAFAAFEAVFALWAEQQLAWAPRDVGYAVAGVGLVAVIIQGGVIGPLTRRLGSRRVLGIGIGVLAVGLAMLPLAQDPVGVGAALAALGAGFALANPTLHALVSRHAGAGRQGASLGIAQSAASLARIAGPVGAGALFAGAGRAWPFLAGAAILIAAGATLWRGLDTERTP